MWGRPLYFPDGEELCFLLTLCRAEHVNDTLFRAVVFPVTVSGILTSPTTVSSATSTLLSQEVC